MTRQGSNVYSIDKNSDFLEEEPTSFGPEHTCDHERSKTTLFRNVTGVGQGCLTITD